MKCPSEHLLSINKFTISNPITHIPPPTIFLPRHRCPVSMSPCPRSMHVALSSGFPFMQMRMLITGHQTRCLQSSFGLQKWHHSLGVFYLISSRTHLQSCSVVCRCRCPTARCWTGSRSITASRPARCVPDSCTL